MKLAQHLALLKNRQLINDELSKIMLEIEQRLISHWHVDVTTKQVEMGLLHLAMALGRIKRGYAAQALHKDIFAEIQSAVCFPKVLKIHSDILALIPFPIPESEQTHLIANWYSLVIAQPWVLNIT
ncbi:MULTISPECIES: hypothetical protein [Basfia]|nr:MULTISPECIES: hypothetical protein [Basfia]SCX79728.1 hypothetical protein SAMN02910354_00367 [Basfia succiniciproducens]SEQ82209.1 hypothetical protein SAMN02910415_02111 [Basfia succiniciproducens]